MFGKKLLSVLALIVGALLLVKALVVLAMFVWGFFGVAPLPLFDPRTAIHDRVILVLQELGIIAFFYVIVGGLYNFVFCCGSECCSMEKPVSGPKAPARRVATRK